MTQSEFMGVKDASGNISSQLQSRIATSTPKTTNKTDYTGVVGEIAGIVGKIYSQSSSDASKDKVAEATRRIRKKIFENQTNPKIKSYVQRKQKKNELIETLINEGNFNASEVAQIDENTPLDPKIQQRKIGNRTVNVDPHGNILENVAEQVSGETSVEKGMNFALTQVEKVNKIDPETSTTFQKEFINSSNQAQNEYSTKLALTLSNPVLNIHNIMDQTASSATLGVTNETMYQQNQTRDLSTILSNMSIVANTLIDGSKIFYDGVQFKDNTVSGNASSAVFNKFKITMLERFAADDGMLYTALNTNFKEVKAHLDNLSTDINTFESTALGRGTEGKGLQTVKMRDDKLRFIQNLREHAAFKALPKTTQDTILTAKAMESIAKIISLTAGTGNQEVQASFTKMILQPQMFKTYEMAYTNLEKSLAKGGFALHDVTQAFTAGAISYAGIDRTSAVLTKLTSKIKELEKTGAPTDIPMLRALRDRLKKVNTIITNSEAKTAFTQINETISTIKSNAPSWTDKFFGQK